MLGVMASCYKELDHRIEVASAPRGSEAALRSCFDGVVGAVTKRDIMDANPSMSKRTVERVLKKLQDAGFVEKVGSAGATAYRRRL